MNLTHMYLYVLPYRSRASDSDSSDSECDHMRFKRRMARSSATVASGFSSTQTARVSRVSPVSRSRDGACISSSDGACTSSAEDSAQEASPRSHGDIGSAGESGEEESQATPLCGMAGEEEEGKKRSSGLSAPSISVELNARESVKGSHFDEQAVNLSIPAAEAAHVSINNAGWQCLKVEEYVATEEASGWTESEMGSRREGDIYTQVAKRGQYPGDVREKAGREGVHVATEAPSDGRGRRGVTDTTKDQMQGEIGAESGRAMHSPCTSTSGHGWLMSGMGRAAVSPSFPLLPLSRHPSSSPSLVSPIYPHWDASASNLEEEFYNVAWARGHQTERARQRQRLSRSPSPVTALRITTQSMSASHHLSRYTFPAHSPVPDGADSVCNGPRGGIEDTTQDSGTPTTQDTGGAGAQVYCESAQT
jgi:hypothetical protein